MVKRTHSISFYHTQGLQVEVGRIPAYAFNLPIDVPSVFVETAWTMIFHIHERRTVLSLSAHLRTTNCC